MMLKSLSRRRDSKLVNRNSKDETGKPEICGRVLYKTDSITRMKNVIEMLVEF